MQPWQQDRLEQLRREQNPSTFGEIPVLHLPMPDPPLTIPLEGLDEESSGVVIIDL